MSRFAIVSISAAIVSESASAASLRRVNTSAASDEQSFDPVEVLCAHGKEDDGSKHIQKWCADWLSCVKTSAVQDMSKEAVKNAWAPADCKEFCGEWPILTPAAASASLAMIGAGGAANISASTVAAARRQMGAGKRDCLDSCANFQDSLSGCVATILFDHGKLSNMGMPDGEDSQPAADEICTKRDSPCMPDLEVRAQKCIIHKSKKVIDGDHKVPLECGMTKMHYEECKNCPQLTQNYQTQYASFTGGCMDQLNAYHAAVHPGAGDSAIPGASGCKVH